MGVGATVGRWAGDGAALRLLLMIGGWLRSSCYLSCARGAFNREYRPLWYHRYLEPGLYYCLVRVSIFIVTWYRYSTTGRRAGGGAAVLVALLVGGARALIFPGIEADLPHGLFGYRLHASLFLTLRLIAY